jgi:hypothetical protein
MDESLDPVAIRALGANRVVSQPHDLADLIQEFELGVGDDTLEARPSVDGPTSIS